MFIALLIACPPPADVATRGEFTVLTYNVHGLPAALTDVPRPTNDRMERISPLLDFDLIGIQEDWTDEGHALLTADVDHPVQEWFETPIDDSRSVGAGLTFLSRVGERTGYFEAHYTTCFGTVDDAGDCLASKGFQVLRLRLGDAEVDVFNTHHEAGGGPEDDAARGAQVDQVLAWMDDRSAGRAVLFMGDTNLRWSDPEDVPDLQKYADAGLVDACDAVACGEDHIDRFLLRDGDDLALTVTSWAVQAQFVDEDGQDLSDHPAIAITVRWSTD